MEPVQPVIFAVTKLVSDRRCVASVVSSHRCMDVGLVESSWTVRSCTAKPDQLTCGTFPLETVSYAVPSERISAQELIRWAVQNQIELHLSSSLAEADLPLLLTTGSPELTYRYRVKVRLAFQAYSSSPDFLADQAFWIRHYQAQVAAGRRYLEKRLDDFQHEKGLASRMEFSSGDTVPATMLDCNNQRHAGCVVIEEALPDQICGGLLCVLGEHERLQPQINRFVRWDEAGVDKAIDSVIAEIIQSEPLG